jgi:prepilin peptidase CpaA
LTYLPPVVQILLLLVVVLAGIFDLRRRRIPNWLTLTGVLAGIALNSFLYERAGLVMSLKGMGLALALYFPLYVLRAMGAGDAKLMAAVGAIVGWTNWLGIMILTALIGGVLAIVLVVTKGRVKQTYQNLGLILIALRLRQAPYQVSPELDVRSGQALRLPHALSILLGSVAFLIAAAIWAPR